MDPLFPWRVTGLGCLCLSVALLCSSVALFAAKDQRRLQHDVYRSKLREWSSDAPDISAWIVTVNGINASLATSTVAEDGFVAQSVAHTATIPVTLLSTTTTVYAVSSTVPVLAFDFEVPRPVVYDVSQPCVAEACSFNCNGTASVRRCSAAALRRVCGMRFNNASYNGPSWCNEGGGCGWCRYERYAGTICVVVRRDVGQWLPLGVRKSCAFPFDVPHNDLPQPPAFVNVTIRGENDPLSSLAQATNGTMSFPAASSNVATAAVLLCVGLVFLVPGLTSVVLSIRRGLSDAQSFVPWVPNGIGSTTARVALAGTMTLTISYLISVVLLDGVAGSVSYLDAEWAFSAENMRRAIEAWDTQGRSAMAASAGAHLLGAVLYPTVLCVWHLRLATAADELKLRRCRVIANVFSQLAVVLSTAYAGGHACVIAVLVLRGPTAEEPVLAAALFLIVFFILLVPTVLSGAALSIIVMVKGRSVQSSSNADPSEQG